MEAKLHHTELAHYKIVFMSYLFKLFSYQHDIPDKIEKFQEGEKLIIVIQFKLSKSNFEILLRMFSKYNFLSSNSLSSYEKDLSMW